MSEVLVFADWYLPGYRAGGPIRSIARLVEALGDEHRFSIFTRDRDLGDDEPYPQVPHDEWWEQGRSRIYYASPRNQGIRSIRARIREAKPDIVYLNSFFSRFTIRVLLLRRFGVLGDTPVVLAPRGEFSPGALGLKARKKAPFLRIAKALRLYDGLLWHMSTDQEADLVRAKMGPVRHVVASDLPELGIGGPERLPQRAPKLPGHARFVYLSRIHPMKNLLYALERLTTIEDKYHLAIYGPVADVEYMTRCMNALTGLPMNARWDYAGVVAPQEVTSTLAAHHFLLLPTQGENFGHVIIEALWAGCPVLISDRTPWRSLGDAGWVIPLEDQTAWGDALRACIGMDQEEFARRSEAAVRFARGFAASTDMVEANRKLFHEALAGRRAK
ncbi:MAG: glycosyltransferase [Fimbriimonadia bacterium]|jgi:glycosyltransferase involved in cell wall biosynthesis